MLPVVNLCFFFFLFLYSSLLCFSHFFTFLVLSNLIFAPNLSLSVFLPQSLLFVPTLHLFLSLFHPLSVFLLIILSVSLSLSFSPSTYLYLNHLRPFSASSFPISFPFPVGKSNYRTAHSGYECNARH